jgi:polysaccharide export outer membrane protein
MKPTPRSPFRTGAVLSAILAAGALAGLARPAAADPTPAAPAFIYALTVSDQVRVDVIDEPDLTVVQKIDALGNLTLPYVNEVHVAGLSKDQAEKAIEDAYVNGRYLRHPQVTLSIQEYAPREVSIQGQVKNSGRFLLPDESTFSVVDLVTKAGGFTDIAKGTDVIITHSGADGKKQVRHVDVQSIIKGKGTLKPDDPSLMLQPGDIVFVPERII